MSCDIVMRWNSYWYIIYAIECMEAISNIKCL